MSEEGMAFFLPSGSGSARLRFHQMKMWDLLGGMAGAARLGTYFKKAIEYLWIE